MTVREPSSGAWDDIDWAALDAAERQAHALWLRGPIRLDAWLPLWTAAMKAAKNRDDALQTLRMYAPAGWEPESSDEK
jgi:hypothetical protein